MSHGRIPIVILGAGPAGLGAAWRLSRRGVFDVTVLERQPVTGGNAGSFEVDGLRVDYGSHRLHPACAPAILADIRSMLGPDLLDRPRHGRIRLRGRWLHFPLRPFDLINVPPGFAVGLARDVFARSRDSADPETFETVLEGSLGRTICRDFYFPYAAKIWGMSPDELDAEQARRRVSAGSLGKLVRKVLGALPGFKPAGSGRFFYPRAGYGQISEAYDRAARESGACIRLETGVVRIETEGACARAVVADGPQGTIELPARQIVSTIPLPSLVSAITPSAPEGVREAISALRYRAMLLVYLVLDADCFTEYDAHYFPATDVAITRLSEPKNYGLAGSAGTTVLCAELPCEIDDPVWSGSDAELGALVRETLARADLPVTVPVRRVVTRRLAHAYPIYTRGYRAHFDRLDAWVGGIDGIVTIGRQGLFAHDNTHHTLAMAYAASDCLDDRGVLAHDRWRLERRAFEQHVVED